MPLVYKLTSKSPTERQFLWRTYNPLTDASGMPSYTACSKARPKRVYKLVPLTGECSECVSRGINCNLIITPKACIFMFFLYYIIFLIRSSLFYNRWRSRFNYITCRGLFINLFTVTLLVIMIYSVWCRYSSTSLVYLVSNGFVRAETGFTKDPDL